MCRDKTKSRSCTDCHQGCYSGHGGCARDKNGNDIQYTESNSQSNQQVEKKNNSSNSVSDTETTNDEDENDEEENNDWIKYTVGATAGGAICYLATRKK